MMYWHSSSCKTVATFGVTSKIQRKTNNDPKKLKIQSCHVLELVISSIRVMKKLLDMNAVFISFTNAARLKK